MTTSESKGRFFYKTNQFESIRITNRIANRNALTGAGGGNGVDEDADTHS